MLGILFASLFLHYSLVDAGKKCEKRAHDYTYGDVTPTSRGQSCELSLHCTSTAICNKNSVCETKRCQNDEECTSSSYLPTRCARVAFMKICKQENCNTDEDCANAGRLNYGCFREHCKPHFGHCRDSCDCVQDYNMVWGEAICHHSKCFCRTAEITSCFSGTPPPPTTTTTPAPTTPTPSSDPVCPAYGNLNRSKKGEKCRAHSGCIPWGGLVCLKPKGQEEGVCEDLKCSSDADCASKTDLPLECLGKWCRKVDCANDKDCPEGYGCYSDNQCRKKLGNCEFDCDCSKCPGVQCFRNNCYCMNDQDDCSSMTGYLSKVQNKPVEPQIVTCPFPHIECPSGWTETSKGCFKVLQEPANFTKATQMCENKGGVLANVMSMMVYEEILEHVLKGILEVWIGIKKDSSNSLKWISDENALSWTPPNLDRFKAGDCISVGLDWRLNDCNLELPSVCQFIHKPYSPNAPVHPYGTGESEPEPYNAGKSEPHPYGTRESEPHSYGTGVSESSANKKHDLHEEKEKNPNNKVYLVDV